MDFGKALENLKAGARVTRAGWDGWVALMPELRLPPFSSQQPGAKVNDRTAKHIGADTPLNSKAYLARWTTSAQEWQPGWAPSQADLIAEDWEMVGPPG